MLSSTQLFYLVLLSAVSVRFVASQAPSLDHYVKQCC